MFIGATRGMTIHAPRSPLTLMGHDGTSDNVLAVPTVDLSLLGDVLPSGVTFTRSTVGTYFNTSGVLTTAAIDAPRFDCDPLTGARRGLLMEGSRTNLLLRSEEFDNASWPKTGVLPFGSGSITNAIAAPDSVVSADKLVEDTSTGVHMVTQNVTIATSTAYSLSLFVKSGERTKAVMRLQDSAASGNRLDLTVDASNGTITATQALGTYTGATSSVIALPNGWYRYTIRGTSGANTAANVLVLLGNGAGSVSYTGDGTSGIYVWGAQLEQATFESSYIKTTTATVTRGGDTATYTPSGINQAATTLLCEWVYANADSSVLPSSRVCATLDDGTSNEYVSIYNTGGIGAAVNSAAAGGTQALNQVAGTKSVGATIRAAAAARANRAITAVDGTLSAADVTVTMPLIASRVRIGQSVHGWVRRILYWPVALPDATLQYLTR